MASPTSPHPVICDLKESNDMSKLVALAGRRNSGKTTAASFLVSLGYKKESFASPMKSMLRAIGVPYCSLYGTNEEKQEVLRLFNMSGRSLMQIAGTEFGRNMIHPDIWVRTFFERHLPPLTVIDDLRFQNELDAVKAKGGLVIRIIRPDSQNLDDDHSSETGINDLKVDQTIINNGTVWDMTEKIKSLLGNV